MSISEIGFRYRTVAFLLVGLLMAYGLASYFNLPAREDPEITVREATVTTRYPGLSAERMERLVTKTVEEAIRQVDEMKEIRSVSMAGLSIIHAQVDDRYFDLDQIWDDMRKRVAEAAADLPDGAFDPVVNDDFGDVAVVTAALTSADFEMRDMFDMAKHVRDQLYGVPGTKRVDMLGVQPERIYIETSNARLAELGLSPDRLQSVLRTQNIIRPGGEVDTGGRAFFIEPTGNFDSLTAIEETLIPLEGGAEPVPLRDIASVSRGYIDPPARKAYVNGEEAIIFAVAMHSDRSVLDYSETLAKRLAEIEAGLPIGYSLDTVTFQADQVANAVYGVTANVLQTLAIVLAVVILFLGLRTGLIVGAIVPAVMLVTIAVMGFFDMTLERMSLATLIIALGLLVDNGIVVAEDFKRRLEEGAARAQALRLTGKELALPLLSSTLTTVLVFLPLMLAEHASGEYTRSISLVILITLLTSWVLAMTVTPSLCHRFIPAGLNRSDRSGAILSSGLGFGPLNRAYERFLRRILRRRRAFLGLMVALLGLSLWGLTLVPNKFFPDSDRAQLLAYIDLPSGVSTRTTDRRMRALFAALKDEQRFPHIEDFAGYVGFGGPRFVLSLTPIDPAPNKGFIVANIDDHANAAETIDAIRTLAREDFADLSARVSGMYLGPSDSTKLEIQIKGPDADYVYAMAGRIARSLSEVPGAIEVRHDWEDRIPKLRVRVDQARARRAGVTSADIARSMERFFSGRPVTEFREGDDIFPIVARAEESERRDLDRVKTLNVFGENSARTVPLLQVADVSLETGFSRIERENLMRTVTVEGRNILMTAEDMVPVIQPQLDALRAELPPNHVIEFDGVVAESAEGQAALSANIPLCVGAILVLLVAQFNSIARPLLIVATIPLLLIGAAVGLHVMQANFGFMVILGLYSLAGIIINNAIVLIDRIDIERAQGGAGAGGAGAGGAGAGGAGADDAIVAASVRRLRPIVMTTVTTILGLMPLIVFEDPLFYGLASVMAFGLAVGTVLTLGVVPVLYSLVFGAAPKPA